MNPTLFAVFACLALAGCDSTPITPAQQAENAACAAQAGAIYQQNTVDQEARTDQTGQRYAATPNHVFDAETMGAQHDYQSQVQHCEDTGNNNGQPVVNGVPVVTPHIIPN